MDKNKFKEILTIIDSNKFGHKNKIGESKYIDIKDLVNNVKDNTISEIDAIKRLNTLNKIKNLEIKHKRFIPGQKELLNLFNDLSDIVLTDKTLMPSKDENRKLKEEKESEQLKEENKKVESRKEENVNENENGNENDYDYENEDEDETMSQNKKNKIIKELNDHLDEIIDKSKSFEDQIKSLKKLEGLKGYWPYKDFGDKELKSKYFKTELADMSNDIDEKLFERIFGHKIIKLVDKLINTTDKKENQIIVENIEKNKDKLFEMKVYSNEWLIQPNSQRINLIETIKLILKFNEKFNYENENENEDNENENENDDETVSQKEKKEIIKRLNDDFGKIINKSKSFEDQIKSIRKVKTLNEYYDMGNYDNNELKLKTFKLQIAHLSNIINEKLFEQILGHTLIKLANKVINTKKKKNIK